MGVDREHPHCDPYLRGPRLRRLNVRAEVGLHENVHELEFSSLYPNIICTQNVPPDIVRCDCHCDCDDVPGLGYSICDDRGYLIEKGLVYTERVDRRKRVVPSDARAVELCRDLVRQHPHIEFPELLTGKALEVLYYLDQSRTVSAIADWSDNYRNTVNRILKRFRDRGLVGMADDRYDFNADFDRLPESARELAHHLHRHRLEAVAPKGTILREDYDEFFTQTETETDAAAFHETGLARFAAFDLQFLLTGHRYYVYSENLDAVSPAELCCHTLLIDDGSRHRSYCLLLLSHVDVDEADLREQAAKYVPEDEIDALLRYLKTHREVNDDRFPEWDELQELAADYEVPLLS